MVSLNPTSGSTYQNQLISASCGFYFTPNERESHRNSPKQTFLKLAKFGSFNNSTICGSYSFKLELTFSIGRSVIMSCLFYSGKMSPMREETFTMTEQELKKLRVIDLAISSSITIGKASELLNLSERQVLRLKKE